MYECFTGNKRVHIGVTTIYLLFASGLFLVEFIPRSLILVLGLYFI